MKHEEIRFLEDLLALMDVCHEIAADAKVRALVRDEAELAEDLTDLQKVHGQLHLLIKRRRVREWRHRE